MSADTQHDPPEAARKSSQRLNPCDYFMLVLDHVVRGQGLPGNVTVFRIDVAGLIDVDRLAMAIGRLHGQHPLLGARLEKRWPWRYRWIDVRFPPDLGVPVPAADDDPRTDRIRSDRVTQDLLVDNVVHRELARGFDLFHEPPIRYRLIPGENRSSLIVAFHHALLDGKGFELLLVRLNELYNRSESPEPHASACAITPSQADPPDAFAALKSKLTLRERFRRFLRARRFAVERNRIAAFRWEVSEGEAFSTAGKSRKLKHAARGGVVQRVIRVRFDEEQSRRIAELATELCGFGQVSAYYMVAASRALAAVAERHGRRAEVLRIPLSVNLRKAGGDGPMIGNHLTFIELLLREDELADRTRLAASIQTQYKGAIREGRDVDMMCALEAGKLLRLDRYAAKRALPDGSEPFSLYVADLGETDRRLDTFLDAPLLEHLPATTFPPETGIGVIFAKTAGRIVATSVHATPPVAHEVADDFAEILRDELLGSE